MLELIFPSTVMLPANPHLKLHGTRITGQSKCQVMWKFQVRGINRNHRNSSKFINYIPIEPNRIIVVEAQPFDSGNYRCVARNDYSQAFAAEVISVEGL